MNIAFLPQMGARVVQSLTAGVFAFGLVCFGVQSAKADTSAFTKDDASFLQDAYQGGLYEIQLAQYALKNASAPAVKTIAQQMITDHTALNEKIATLAQNKNVTLDMSPNAVTGTKITAGTVLTGTAFDKTYLSMMASDHRSDIKAFRKEEAETADGDVKSLAKDALPTIHHHLKMIEEAQGNM